MPAKVRNNTHLCRYEMVLDGAVAFVGYERDGDRIVCTHTEVPPTLAGRAVGSALVRAALDTARRERLRVVPRCDFVASFVRHHAAYQGLMVAEEG
jgi:predicted GNAT family acetyltransferase